MATLDEVKKQIKEYKYKANADYFDTLAWREIRRLPNILREKEKIFALTSGMLKSNTWFDYAWLITLTNERIVFLDMGWFWFDGLTQVEIPLDKVDSIQYNII